MHNHDVFNSPGSLLAKYFSKEQRQPGLFLLTGPPGSGKTTWCLELVKHARFQGIPIAGLVSPPIFENNQRAGIDLLDIESGERTRLATRRSTTTPRDESNVEKASPTRMVTAGWQFDPAALVWGNRLLIRLIAQKGTRSQPHPSRLVVLDELGPLEFTRGQGLKAGLNLISACKYRLACVVVRPSLTSVAQDLWPWVQVCEFSGPINTPATGCEP